MRNEKEQSTWGKESCGLLPCSSTPLWSQEKEGETTDAPQSKPAAGRAREVGEWIVCDDVRWNCTSSCQEQRKLFILSREVMG